jgi:nucleoid-associated protein EbfC
MPQPNFNKMLKQVQQMQEQMQVDMAKAQEELKTEEVEASAGGGMVSVKVTGEREVKAITIDPGAIGDAEIAPEDVEMLQDMLLAAVNEALRSAKALEERKMSGLSAGLGGLGDLGIPGL